MSADNNVSFNLLTQPWVPVVLKTDGSTTELSILEVLRKSKDIQCISGDNPLQEFAISRLFLAFLYGAFGNSFTEEMWRNLFERGPEDEEVWSVIEQYANDFKDRFDLFDVEKPFYQVAGLHNAKNEVSELERLIIEVPSGDHFFTIRGGESLERMTAAEAARWLITIQAYDASGIKTGAVGDTRVRGGKGYPIGVAWSGHLGGLLCEGTDYWSTLMFNFVSSHVLKESEAYANWEGDSPVWERSPLMSSIEEGYNQPEEYTGIPSYFHGPATLFTWQSRRVLLIHEEAVVTGVLICNGDRLKPQNAYSYETMTAWSRSDPQEKKLKQPLVYMPQTHDPSRALWRNLPTLVISQQSDVNDIPQRLRPKNIDWLAKITQNLGERYLVRLHAYGVQYGNQEAVIDATVNDELDVNVSILTAQEPQVGEMITRSVELIDQGISALGYFAQNIAKAEGIDPEGPESYACELGYSTFDQLFRQWIPTVTANNLSESIAKWEKTVRLTLLRLSQQIAGMASPKAIVGRYEEKKKGEEGGPDIHYSVAYAELGFRATLNRLIPRKENEKA